MARPPLATWRHRLKRARQLAGVLLLGLLAVTLAASCAGMLRTTVERPAPAPIVNDVTGLNPIPVAEVIAPTTTEEIVAAVRDHAGPIAIGGGRYSMGGQTAAAGAVQIDMRRFDRIVEIDTAAKLITVQAGATWRQIQEAIDPLDLSIAIMQTYANFTVGGSLSVNVHGRYVGRGPLILSVRSLEVVLADGSAIVTSPTEHPEIFYGVIGGYGGLGVITQATLALTDNVRVKRHDRTMPITEYRRHFFERVRESATAVFHNADIYPNGFDAVHAITFDRTDEPVTVHERLIPANRSYRLNKYLFEIISEWPLGKTLRRRVVDPVIYRGEPVAWRNYEASYDAAELGPIAGEASSYVLQEYFVPVGRFDEFVPLMRDVFRRHRVNVINVSIRHAHADPGSLLAWAREEVFAFVVYYKQGADEPARHEVGAWTRELIDAVLRVGGSYYLPYQLHATPEQFHQAYPRAPEFFALKQRLDPTSKFRNKLWDTYYRSPGDSSPPDLSPAIHARLAERPGYRRAEGQTFLTHPEWYIVYSSDEYADYLRDRLPTDFPYVASTGQYWTNYREALALTGRPYPFNWGYNVMLWVIGVSYSAELTVKALYENSTGRFTGWTAGGALSDEDRYAHAVAEEYGRFIHVRPWYEYPFAAKLRGLWTDTPLFGAHLIRKWERKVFLTAEYGIKAVYGGVIHAATRLTYGTQDDRVHVVVAGWDDSLVTGDGRIDSIERLDDAHALLAAPRYDELRDAMFGLAGSGAPIQIQAIAGNDEIALTGVAPAGWVHTGGDGTFAYALPLPTDAARKRVLLRVPVRRLLPLLRQLDSASGLAIDHIYDY